MTEHLDPVVTEMFMAGDRLTARLEASLALHDLTLAKYRVLSLLAEEKGTRMPLSVLAEKLSCARSNVTGLIDRLEVEGLVRRSASSHDGRITYAEMTPKGQARLDAVHPVYLAALQEVLDNLSAAERDELVRLLQKLRGRN